MEGVRFLCVCLVWGGVTHARLLSPPRGVFTGLTASQIKAASQGSASRQSQQSKENGEPCSPRPLPVLPCSRAGACSCLGASLHAARPVLPDHLVCAFVIASRFIEASLIQYYSCGIETSTHSVQCSSLCNRAWALLWSTWCLVHGRKRHRVFPAILLGPSVDDAARPRVTRVCVAGRRRRRPPRCAQRRPGCPRARGGADGRSGHRV